jgi:hypothetical protein
MSSETLVPNGLLVQTNLTGALSAINADDSTWLTATVNNAASFVRVSFPTPAKLPAIGAGLQNFSVKYRVTPNAGLITFTAYLYENGSIRNSGASIDAWASTSTAGATRDIAWNANLLSAADGSQVEVEIVTTFVGGGPGSRTTGEFQFIDWDVQHQGVSGTGASSAQSATTSGTAIREHVGAGAASAQAATVAGEAVWTPTNAGFCVSGPATVAGAGYVIEDTSWTPADITTEVWLDANDTATLTIVNFQSDDRITRWGDKSGNDYSPSVSSFSYTRSPVHRVAAQNGLNVVRFDGVDDYLKTAASNIMRNIPSALVYIAAKYNTANSSPKVLADVAHNTAFLGYRAQIVQSSSYSTAGNPTDGGAITASSDFSLTPDTGWHIQGGILEYTAKWIRTVVDGTIRHSANATGWSGGNTSDTAARHFAVGAQILAAYPDGRNFSPADIGEVIIVASDVTAATRQKIEGYLAWRWGLGASLPSGHPYENGPPQNSATYNALVADSGPLGAPSVIAARSVDAWASDASLLGAPHVKAASTSGLINVPSMLQSPAVWSYVDFTAALTGSEPEIYVMELTTPGGSVRVPVSSWSATLQTGSDNAAQCIVPAAFDWMEYISDASAFSIYRTVLLHGQEYAELMSSSSLELTQFTQSSSGIVCTLSGRSAGYDAETDPETVYDRTLTGIRSISSGRRVRCDIDFLLKPGHRAFARGSEIIVGKIGYYVARGIAYMDVWEAE